MLLSHQMKKILSKLLEAMPPSHSHTEAMENAIPMKNGNVLGQRFLQQEAWKLFVEARYNSVPLPRTVNLY